MITTTLALTSIISKQMEMEVREGLIYILNHLDDLWPRMISTHATKRGQIPVKDFAEAMDWFKASSFLDCCISAYPKYTNDYISSTGIAPTVLMADIDTERFKTLEEFDLCVARTYSNFHTILGSRPTQLFTGGGIHFIQPQQVPVPEKLEEFGKFDQASRKFIQFEEQLLTDGNADQRHWRSVSFHNMMLRIPGSINSKYIQFDDLAKGIPYDARVRIEKHWDGNIPSTSSIKELLTSYYIWREAGVIEDIRKRLQREQNRKLYRYKNGDQQEGDRIFEWIENLFDNPIDSHRYFCSWRIFVPYLVNVRKRSRQDASDMILSWLDKCNSLKRLKFSSSVYRSKIDYALDHVGDCYPIGRLDLEQENTELFCKLKEDGVIY